MNKFAKQLLPFCSLIFIVSLWACLEPENFLSVQNFSNVLRRSSVNGIMAAGMTFIINRVGGRALLGRPSSHTTVRAVRHTAVQHFEWRAL